MEKSTQTPICQAETTDENIELALISQDGLGEINTLRNEERFNEEEISGIKEDAEFELFVNFVN
jgi:hypothetical protein